MNVQPMALDLNTLRGPQQTSKQPVSGKQEDSFSNVLEKSKEKHEAPSKEIKEKDSTTQGSKDKVEAEPKVPVTKEISKPKEANLEDDLSALEKNQQVTQAIADLLNITVEDLEQMLAALQIGISDLLKGDNLQQLLMQVHGAEEPMDLLLIPEVIADMKNITAVVEEYTANTILEEPGVEVLDTLPKVAAVGTEPAAELGKEEPVLRPEVQGAAGADQKNTDEAPKANQESIATELGEESVTQMKVAEPSHENSSQTEEQATPNQNNAANQFLDQLTQSMGDAFRAQNTPVTEAFETVVSRHEPVNPRMVLDQIVEKIKVSSLENEAQMNIQLKPAHLGKLSMEVVSKQGIMTAHITVENEKTKAMLEQNLQSLRESLENNGLVIEELEVAVGQNQNEDRPGYEGKKPNRNISDIISDMMNEEILEEEIKPENLFNDDTNEVDFIA